MSSLRSFISVKYTRNTTQMYVSHFLCCIFVYSPRCSELGVISTKNTSLQKISPLLGWSIVPFDIVIRNLTQDFVVTIRGFFLRLVEAAQFLSRVPIPGSIKQT